MEHSTITQVEVIGMHAQYDVRVSLQPGLNILFGTNGSGKTTFLHVLANLVNADIERFCHIHFRRISVTTLDGSEIVLRQEHQNKYISVLVIVDGDVIGSVRKEEETPPHVTDVIKHKLGGRPVYLPAFRSVLEAIGSRAMRYAPNEESKQNELQKIIDKERADASTSLRSPWSVHLLRERSSSVAYKTLLCRDWFGPFVPIVRCPSLWEVFDELVNEYQIAQLDVASTDRAAFSQVFVRVLEASLLGGIPHETGDVRSLLIKIRNSLAHLENVDAEVRGVYETIASLVDKQTENFVGENHVTRILKVYEKALSDRAKGIEQAFYRIRTFENSLNRFLKGKKLDIEFNSRQTLARQRTSSIVTLANGLKGGLSVLSSGERQVLTLLFSATHMSVADGIVLIDEPEISLHVGWQRIILQELIKQSGARQIVTCTHSPEISAFHRDVTFELKPHHWQGDLFPGEELSLEDTDDI